MVQPQQPSLLHTGKDGLMKLPLRIKLSPSFDSCDTAEIQPVSENFYITGLHMQKHHDSELLKQHDKGKVIRCLS